MSLSQKHTGKVLVPWFNAAEWKTVYQLIYCNDAVLQKKALEILYVWKIRTPILPSGVEGTLIILEALLANCSELTQGEISALYSTAVLRFLNICAASNDRQGTFVKLAKENDIPDWLVSIRHDIAHDSRIPSVAMLKICLDYCINWVEEKYWKEQLGMENDFVVGEQRNDGRTYSLLYTYIFVNFNLYKGKYYDDLDDRLKSVLCSVLPKKLRKLSPSLYVLRSYLLDMLLNEDDGSEEFQRCAEEMMSELVKPEILLSVTFESSDNGTKYIPNDFRDYWIDLLKIYLHKDVIFSLLEHLLKTTNNELYDSKIREIAATWILEIFNGLLRLKYSINEHGGADDDEFAENHPELINALDFGKETVLPVNKARLFLDIALRDANDTTLIYLKRVFEFLCLSKEMEEIIMRVFNCLFAIGGNHHDTEVLTIENLDFLTNSEENVCNGDKNSHKCIDNKPAKRWKKIDASKFEGCPLGVLPHQDRSQNPLLIL